MLGQEDWIDFVATKLTQDALNLNLIRVSSLDACGHLCHHNNEPLYDFLSDLYDMMTTMAMNGCLFINWARLGAGKWGIVVGKRECDPGTEVLRFEYTPWDGGVDCSIHRDEKKKASKPPPTGTSETENLRPKTVTAKKPSAGSSIYNDKSRLGNATKPALGKKNNPPGSSIHKDKSRPSYNTKPPVNKEDVSPAFKEEADVDMEQ